MPSKHQDIIRAISRATSTDPIRRYLRSMVAQKLQRTTFSRRSWRLLGWRGCSGGEVPRRGSRSSACEDVDHVQDGVQVVPPLRIRGPPDLLPPQPCIELDIPGKASENAGGRLPRRRRLRRASARTGRRGGEGIADPRKIYGLCFPGGKGIRRSAN